MQHVRLPPLKLLHPVHPELPTVPPLIQTLWLHMPMRSVTLSQHLKSH